MKNENPNKITIPPADLEPYPRNESTGTHRLQKIDTLAHIHVLSKRHRFTDPGGISDKWAIDAIKEAGILKDDSRKFVSKITESQEKISKSEPEMTIITIETIGDIDHARQSKNGRNNGTD